MGVECIGIVFWLLVLHILVNAVTRTRECFYLHMREKCDTLNLYRSCLTAKILPTKYSFKLHPPKINLTKNLHYTVNAYEFVFVGSVVMASTWRKSEILKPMKYVANIQKQLEGCHHNREVYMHIACRMNDF